ncbi:hypothetical protein RchiOBHm_Chr2g0109111 [Rosa chinensis]|uniref:Uncharacterized protein n=1 Tax=Rosa chinensis TaxID=74649 RepID=A0A2P6RPD0_ROSCH|nr:hypothetical protein RchiOBHm_Chr2g0109111 [Rosa chinensis]
MIIVTNELGNETRNWKLEKTIKSLIDQHRSHYTLLSTSPNHLRERERESGNCNVGLHPRRDDPPNFREAAGEGIITIQASFQTLEEAHIPLQIRPIPLRIGPYEPNPNPLTPPLSLHQNPPARIPRIGPASLRRPYVLEATGDYELIQLSANYGVIVNEKLHWVIEDYNLEFDEEEDPIVAFDLESEEFRRLRLPFPKYVKGVCVRGVMEGLLLLALLLFGSWKGMKTMTRGTCAIALGFPMRLRLSFSSHL